jgi:biopolymer transport protein ExbB/TolQ
MWTVLVVILAVILILFCLFVFFMMIVMVIDSLKEASNTRKLRKERNTLRDLLGREPTEDEAQDGDGTRECYNRLVADMEREPNREPTPAEIEAERRRLSRVRVKLSHEREEHEQQQRQMREDSARLQLEDQMGRPPSDVELQTAISGKVLYGRYKIGDVSTGHD